MTTTIRTDLQRIPLLGTLEPATVRRHMVQLPGSALQGDTWPVTTICGARPGPVVFVSAGVHGCEYPAIEAAVRLSRSIDPGELAGLLVIMPVVNLPSFRQRTPFVCPEDGLNPNRTFPGDPSGSYTEQLVNALTEEFIVRADVYIDLHGGDLVEDLVPFSVCRRGDDPVDRTAFELASVFGLPYLLAVDRPVQAASGNMSFVAAAERGVPGFIAEAGRTGLLEDEPVQTLLAGLSRVLTHLDMLDRAAPPSADVTVLTTFEWLYSQHAGLFHTTIAVGEGVASGQVVGTIDDLFGDCLEEVVAPVTGRVLFLTANPSVTHAGLLMGIGVSA